jgi:prepilin-type N-terminal cleavage/methylation domain-containing protein
MKIPDTTSRGFTIVELLIVIVVIGILAALVLNSFAGAQDRARAAAIVDGVRKIEKALRATAMTDGMSTWWDDATLKDANGESTLDHVRATTSLGQYLKEVPKVSGFENTFWTYDNDGDTYGGCAADSKGVNIQMETTNVRISQYVDDILDDKNLSCGKIRRDAQGELVYLISVNATVQ